jgi:S1-C subfamily serine protease
MRFLGAGATTWPVIRRLLAVVAALVAVTGFAYDKSASAATPSPTRGVVLVNTNLALENASAAGTGIVLTKNGEVLTNNHVIAGATTINVTIPATKRTHTADVLGYDLVHDVALLKLENASNLATATIGDSAKLRIGNATRAVGNANGAGKLVVTSGKVLALKQAIDVQQDDGSTAPLSNLIKTSARLVPGNSGGPLLNASGRVVGVDAAGSASTGTTVAPGYAIPINRALTIVKQIEALRSSTVVHIGATAFIGLQVQDAQNGVAVAGVYPGSPASTAGLQQGDVLTSVDGVSLANYKGLRTVLFGHHPGDTITIAYTDALGNAATATVTLASGPPQ